MPFDKSIYAKNLISNAKGLEKVIFIAADAVIAAQEGLDKVINGKPLKAGESAPKNPLELGINPILDFRL